jgi:hypothetical protein
MNDSALNRPSCGLRSVIRAKFLEDVFDVVLCRVLRNLEFVRDLLVGETLDD